MKAAENEAVESILAFFSVNSILKNTSILGS